MVELDSSTASCMFCNKTLKTNLSKFYYCPDCRSEQLYKENGEIYDYSFMVGEYRLYFCTSPSRTEFSIHVNVHNNKIFITNVLPNLTPQNTTLDKIKMYLALQ